MPKVELGAPKQRKKKLAEVRLMHFTEGNN